jgi:hypothetical protein
LATGTRVKFEGNGIRIDIGHKKEV